MRRQICILLALVVAYASSYSLGRLASTARRYLVQREGKGSEVTLPKEKSKEQLGSKRVRRLVANAGLLAGGMMPGKAVAQQRQPAAIVAETAKARQNPRDVWTGGKKTEAPVKDDLKLGVKVQKPSVADIKMGTSSFVSSELIASFHPQLAT